MLRFLPVGFVFIELFKVRNTRYVQKPTPHFNISISYIPAFGKHPMIFTQTLIYKASNDLSFNYDLTMYSDMRIVHSTYIQ